ncbi:O-antigen ligase family protein [Maricurvus nonylphenolicus]|uniref:O-antigen ligase family protein n=1 Tax=Maricurvus nonylphenolicus TaxID=1008307 RepID=UPI0036F3C3EC
MPVQDQEQQLEQDHSLPVTSRYSLVSQAPLTLLLGLALAYIFSPLFQFHFGPLGYNDARVIEIAVISVASLGFIYHLFFKRHLLSSTMSWYWLGLFGLAWLSLNQAPYFQAGLQELGLYAGLLMAIWVVAHETRQLSNKQIQALTTVLVLAVVTIYAMQFLVYYLGQLLLQDTMSSKVLLPNFQNPRSFNHSQAWLMPVAAWAIYYLSSRNRLYYQVALVMVALWWVMLFYSNGRGILLSLMSSGVALYVLCPQERKRILRPLLGTLLLGIGLYLLLFLGIPKLITLITGEGSSLSTLYSDRLQQTHSGGRSELWQASLALLQQYPWLGIGPQHFPAALEGLGSPHNMALATAVELGVPALLLLAFILAKNLLSSYQQYRQGPTPLQASLLTAAVCALIYSNLTGIALTPVSQLLMVLICGLLLGLKQQHSTTTPGNQKVWLLFCSLLVVLWASSLWLSVGNLMATDTSLYVPGQNQPRFWLNGHYYY